MSGKRPFGTENVATFGPRGSLPDLAFASWEELRPQAAGLCLSPAWARLGARLTRGSDDQVLLSFFFILGILENRDSEFLAWVLVSTRGVSMGVGRGEAGSGQGRSWLGWARHRGLPGQHCPPPLSFPCPAGPSPLQAPGAAAPNGAHQAGSSLAGGRGPPLQWSGRPWGLPCAPQQPLSSPGLFYLSHFPLPNLLTCLPTSSYLLDFREHGRARRDTHACRRALSHVLINKNSIPRAEGVAQWSSSWLPRARPWIPSSIPSTAKK